MPGADVLPREIGVGHAILIGLGSMLGAGIFVAVALGTQVAGAGVLLALVIAALVATANALSSAQLAAEHPVSGGTYAYGHRHLTPYAGFTAGWVFLVAKTLSAAVAAVGTAAYLLLLVGIEGGAWTGALAAAIAVAITLLVAAGLRRSARGNAVLVGITLAGLLAFVALGAPRLEASGGALLEDLGSLRERAGGAGALLHAGALMFVAFAGYARLATLGEEIRDPERNLPRAILATVGIALALYLVVAGVALAVMGPGAFAATLDDGAAPLAHAARALAIPWVAPLVSVAAVTALLGVLLNLVLGLSRMLLAMARHGEMPRCFARLDPTGRSPRRAVIAVGLLIAAVAAALPLHAAWSLSAFAVLIYYALTNLAALRLPTPVRRYPRWIAWGGLVGTTGLAAFIEPRLLLVGLALLLAGTAWYHGAKKLRARDRTA